MARKPVSQATRRLFAATVELLDSLAPPDWQVEVDTIITSEWLSPRSRELLEDIGYGYVDQTGNVNAVVKRPGIVFRTEGAQRDPSPSSVPRLNIRGPRAWALLRTLTEVQPPYGVGDLARAVNADAGYISRLLDARFQRDDQLDRVRRARTVPRRSRREQHQAMGHYRIVRCVSAHLGRRARDRSRLRRRP